MSDIIQIEILDKSGHDDLKFCVHGLTGDLTLDTYYFQLAIEPLDNIRDVKTGVANFLKFWVDNIGLMENGQAKYFPIDFSDQYTGCLKIVSKQEDLEIEYGISDREGWSIDISNPSDYFDGITDFHPDTSTVLSVKKSDFTAAIQCQIQSLSGNA